MAASLTLLTFCAAFVSFMGITVSYPRLYRPGRGGGRAGGGALPGGGPSGGGGRGPTGEEQSGGVGGSVGGAGM